MTTETFGYEYYPAYDRRLSEVVFDIEVGHYVSYKETFYIVTKVLDDNKKIQILNPLESVPTKAKLCVNKDNVDLMMLPPASIVQHQGTDYLVTIKGCIISLATNRVMKWDNNNSNRKAILAASKGFIAVTNN